MIRIPSEKYDKGIDPCQLRCSSQATKSPRRTPTKALVFASTIWAATRLVASFGSPRGTASSRRTTSALKYFSVNQLPEYKVPAGAAAADESNNDVDSKNAGPLGVASGTAISYAPSE